MPSPRGCATPCPSTKIRSGCCGSSANACSTAGNSRNDSSPGIYGIRVGNLATTSAIGRKVPASINTAAARVIAPPASKPTSTPASRRSGGNSSSSRTRSASSVCSARARVTSPSHAKASPISRSSQLSMLRPFMPLAWITLSEHCVKADVAQQSFRLTDCNKDRIIGRCLTCFVIYSSFC